MLHIYFAPRAFSPRQMPSVTRSISQGQKLVSRQTLGVHEIINSNFLRIMEKNPAISTIFFSELLFPDPEILASKTIFRAASCKKSTRKNKLIRKNKSTRTEIFRYKISVLVDLFFLINLFFSY